MLACHVILSLTALLRTAQAVSISNELLDALFQKGIAEADDVVKFEQLWTLQGRTEDKGNVDIRLGAGGIPLLGNKRVRQMHEAQISFQSVFGELNNANITVNNNVGPFQQQAIERCVASMDQPSCDPGSRYRAPDGTCNNLEHPSWGSAFSCLRRLLPAHYAGESGFRVSADGSPLPNARMVSSTVHQTPGDGILSRLRGMFTYFGQFISHDISLTPQTRTRENKAIQCCPPEATMHPQCAPILVSRSDTFYGKYGYTCMNFVRSTLCPTCMLGSRNQMNVVTAFIDASAVYGNFQSKTELLREKDGTGRLRTQTMSSGDMLPSTSDPMNDQCSFISSTQVCYEGGDGRINQNSALASLHTVFLREHNRIVGQLKRVNRFWGEETLFQEARRIVIAELQYIVYHQYLPLLLGSDAMTRYRLWVENEGNTVYEPELDSSLFNEFATAAMRFGHSMVENEVFKTDTGNNRFMDDFFRMDKLQVPGMLEQTLVGTSTSPSQELDSQVVPDVLHNLLKLPGQPYGLDLAAINIQRGRDHGLPPYAEVLKSCSGDLITLMDFGDLTGYNLITEPTVNVIMRNYRDVQDIDLWTGVLIEGNTTGAVVGPVGACILGMQFERLKYGDRFYFEHGGQVGSFTKEQLKAIKSVSLSNIMCANTQIGSIPLNAFVPVSLANPLVPCYKLPGIDLSAWKV